MNAPTPALVAPRPERLRLVGQRRQILAVMHQRLMFGMLVYAGIIALIALRILWLAAFGDHAGRREGLTMLIPDRGDIVDRDGEPLARTIDAWTIAVHPTKVIGDKLALAGRLALLMPEHTQEQYFAMLRSGKPFFYLRRRASNVGYPDEFWALERAPDRAPEAPATIAAVAGLAAGLALRWLLFEDPFVAGVLATLELGDETRLSQHAVYRVPRCAACSPAAAQAPPLPWAEAS